MEEAGTAFERGKELFRLGNAQEAIAYLRQAVQEDPSSSVAQEYLGAALASIGDQEGCVTAFQEALRLDPGNARYDYNLGKAYETWGQTSLAVAAYRKAVEIDPGHEKARAALEALGGEAVPDAEESSEKGHGDEPQESGDAGLDGLEALKAPGGIDLEEDGDRPEPEEEAISSSATEPAEPPPAENAPEPQANTKSYATDSIPVQPVPPPPAAPPGERPLMRPAPEEVPASSESVASPSWPIRSSRIAPAARKALDLGAIAVIAILVIGYLVIARRADSPIKTVTQFVQAQKQLDMDTLSKVVTAGSQPMVDQMRAQRADPRLKALMENVTYDLGKPSISGDNATVPLRLAMNRLGVSVAVEQAVYCVKQNGVWKVDWIKTEQEQEKKVRGGLGAPPAIR